MRRRSSILLHTTRDRHHLKLLRGDQPRPRWRSQSSLSNFGPSSPLRITAFTNAAVPMSGSSSGRAVEISTISADGQLSLIRSAAAIPPAPA